MNDNQSKNIEKIINRIDSIIDYCNGCKNLDDFQNNSMLVEACVFNLTQIGELVTKISEKTKNLNKEIPWKDISGMRNKIVHDYFSINLNIVWDTIQNDLPKLRISMNDLISKL